MLYCFLSRKIDIIADYGSRLESCTVPLLYLEVDLYRKLSISQIHTCDDKNCFTAREKRRKDKFVMEKTQKTNTKKPIIAVVVLVAVVALVLTAYYFLVPRGVEGAKTITVIVTIDGEETLNREIHTDAAYLRGALEENGLIEGEETAFGLWVQAVNGRFADDENAEWWALYVNGDFAMLGVDEQPIEDGDIIEYRLTVGFDDMDW